MGGMMGGGGGGGGGYDPSADPFGMGSSMGFGGGGNAGGDMGGGSMPGDWGSAMQGWDPSQFMGMYNNPDYGSQAAMQPVNAPTDPTTGQPQNPAAGQQSGQQTSPQTDALSQLAQQFGNTQASMRMPTAARAPNAPTAPSWYQRQPNPASPYMEAGAGPSADPSAFGGGYAGADYSSAQTPSPPARRAAPAPAPAPAAQPPQLPGAAPQQELPGAPPQADPRYQPMESGISGADLTTPTPDATNQPGYTYDPSQDPFGAGQTIAASPTHPGPLVRVDKMSDPNDPRYQPMESGTSGANLPTATAMTPMESGTSGATPGTAAVPYTSGTAGQLAAGPTTGAQALAPQPTGETTTPPGAIPTTDIPSTIPSTGAGAGQPAAGGQQAGGQMPMNPFQLLTDLLFGGPQKLFSDLQSVMGQVQGGQQGGMPPWMTGYGPGSEKGERLRPEDRAAAQQAIQQYRRSGNVPSATISPQSPKISGETPATSTTATTPGAAAGATPAVTTPEAPQPLPEGYTRPPAGVPDDRYNRALMQIESGYRGQPGYKARATGSNYGLGQFGPNEMRRYGLRPDQINDPRAVAQAIQREKDDQRPHIMRANGGTEPTPAQYYLTHQQGTAGGPALINAARTNPNVPAWQVINRYYKPGVAVKAIHGNIPRDNPLSRVPGSQVTAGQFVQMWEQRFNRAMGPTILRPPVRANAA